MNAKRAGRGIVILGLMLAAAGSASAADGSEEAFSARIGELERKIAVLERRVQALEGPAAEAPPATAVPSAQVYPGQWKDERNWRNLKGRMTEGDVEELLGQPVRTKSVGKFVYWYYGEHRVVFYLGRVESWLAP